MNVRALGQSFALTAVAVGLIAAGCARTIDGEAVANETDRAAYVSSVSSSAAAATSARAHTAKVTVCGGFFRSAVDVKFKLSAFSRELEAQQDREAARTKARAAATALSSAATTVTDALRDNPSIPAVLNSALSEYASAAKDFASELNKLAAGSTSPEVFIAADDRYRAARDAALDSCS
ncbi:hypothetical protein IU474_05190 [Nocardia otitidiscaviarum]|uniref:hypothetical protein n=1 Tax=Nocardia otitidiscaviarum TaxID=1823 RepID=UPI0018960236|nr:hypothetical protein [Nocardia otitidiscaviarum]MBF6236474.1 hypothetical protein [Nocardia otitidiscaviarum]